MKSLIFLSLALALGLVSCSSLPKDHTAQTCHHRDAYVMGVNDRVEGKNPSPERFSECSSSERERALRAYHRGYQRNIQVLAQGQGDPLAQEQDHLYVCRASAFTDDYRQEGKSLLEARNKVLAECSEKHAAVFCGRIDCETRF